MDGCVVISLSAVIQFVYNNRLKWNFCKAVCRNTEAKLTKKWGLQCWIYIDKLQGSNISILNCKDKCSP